MPKRLRNRDKSLIRLFIEMYCKLCGRLVSYGVAHEFWRNRTSEEEGIKINALSIKASGWQVVIASTSNMTICLASCNSLLKQCNFHLISMLPNYSQY